MKIHIYITALIAICTTSASNAANHKHAKDNSCWYETDYGKKSNGDNWAYYFCGPAAKKCDGKKHKGHDKLVVLYHGNSFTFKTTPQDKYFCCGGTKDKSGYFVRGNNWIEKTEEETINVTGGTCKKTIKTDVCGEVYITECDTPDECDTDAGLFKRNNECVAQCEGDEVFESTRSNNCIKCETTLYQGPDEKHSKCIKCDTATQFYDRKTKDCIQKNSEKVTKYSNAVLKECWRCPDILFEKCVKAVNDKLEGKSDTYPDTVKTKCYLED